MIAAARSPQSASALQALAQSRPEIRLETLDVADGASVAALAARYARQPVDLLVNNAGVLSPLPFAEHLRRQHFGTLDYGLWEDILRTNTLGSVRITEAFTEHVAASEQKKIVTISSSVGSIGEGRRGAIGYASSKAALNKAMTLIARELEPRGIIVALLCPGYVKTDMNVGGATVEPADSVSGMRGLIAKMGIADSGTFTRYNGEPIGW